MEDEAPTLNAQLRGARFRGQEAVDFITSVNLGDELGLEREPDNAYDVNAIKVLNPENGEHVAYVEKDVAAVIAPYLDEGVEFRCKVVGAATATTPIGELSPVKVNA